MNTNGSTQLFICTELNSREKRSGVRKGFKEEMVPDLGFETWKRNFPRQETGT